jgi:signal transduction histidine kinase
VPLLDKGRVVGALTARSRQPQRFGEDETRFLESLANLLTTILLRAQSDEALRHAQRLESVGQLTGGIAHDFNNLLTVIQGNLQVLEELPAIETDEYGQQLLASAMRAARRGAELTGKLLAFSRRQVLQPSPVDLGAMLQSLADMLRRTIDQRVRIVVEAAPDCPPCLADPGQLESALLNIAINARDAMPQGGELLFKAQRCELLPPPLYQELAESAGAPPKHDDYVTIAISDTGTGMPESVKERAFEPFFTTKEAGRGTGLGLSTVYGFAKQSRGGVTIDSSQGAGTTITLYLPQVKARRDTRVGNGGVAADVPPGLKVLVVEDEPEVLRVVQAFLAGWQCEVTASRSAEHALALLQAQDTRFDLLLTDIVLGPGMRGTELGMRASQLDPDLAVLLMSGYASDLLAGETTGGAMQPDLLRKPFSREALAAAIAKAVLR